MITEIPSPSTQQMAWKKALTGCLDRDDVVAHISAALISGRLAPGTAVPKQRSLAEWSGLARETVRLALVELTAMGLILHHGRRSTLASPTAAPIESGSVLILARLMVFAAGPDIGTSRLRIRGTEYEVAAHLRDLLVAGGIPFATAAAEGMSSSAAEAIIAARPAIVVLIDWAEDSGIGSGLLARLTRAGVPVVSSNSHCVPPGGDAVDSDHRAAGRLQARAALERGADAILRLWAVYPNQAGLWLPERDAGVMSAAKRARMAVLPPVVLRSFEDGTHGGANSALEWAMVGALACMLRCAEKNHQRCAVLLSSDAIGPYAATAFQRLHMDPFPGGQPPIIGCDWSAPYVVAGRPWTPACSLDRQPQIRAQHMANLIERRRHHPQAEPRRVLVPPIVCVTAAIFPGDLVRMPNKAMEIEARLNPGTHAWV